jgi:hypothetical protein
MVIDDFQCTGIQLLRTPPNASDTRCSSPRYRAAQPVEHTNTASTGQTIANLLMQTALNVQQQHLEGQALNKQAIALALQQTVADQSAKLTEVPQAPQQSNEISTEQKLSLQPAAQTRAVTQSPDVLITQNSIDPTCANRFATLHYGLTNNSTYPVNVTVSIDCRIGGVENHS